MRVIMAEVYSVPEMVKLHSGAKKRMNRKFKLNVHVNVLIQNMEAMMYANKMAY